MWYKLCNASGCLHIYVSFVLAFLRYCTDISTCHDLEATAAHIFFYLCFSCRKYNSPQHVNSIFGDSSPRSLYKDFYPVFIQVDDEKAISGSYDKTLKVWGIKTGECRMTLR